MTFLHAVITGDANRLLQLLLLETHLRCSFKSCLVPGGALLTVNPEDIVWSKNLVIVPAHYNELLLEKNRPSWIVDSVKSPNQLTYQVYMEYQRIDPSAANFVPNYGYEGGLYLRFLRGTVVHFPARFLKLVFMNVEQAQAMQWLFLLADFHDNMPNITLFIQAKPQDHNPNFINWIECLRDDNKLEQNPDFYLSLNAVWLAYAWSIEEIQKRSDPLCVCVRPPLLLNV